LYLDNDGVDLVVKEYERDTKALKDELFKLCWYMRGGVTISEAFLLTADDRLMISLLIEENLKITKDSGLPFF
jgi:hypothetical protein